MNEDIYIMDIDKLKELLGDNFNNCLNDINKESNISKYFSTEYLKDYFSKVDKENPEKMLQIRKENRKKQAAKWNGTQAQQDWINSVEGKENIKEQLIVELYSK